MRKKPVYSAVLGWVGFSEQDPDERIVAGGGVVRDIAREYQKHSEADAKLHAEQDARNKAENLVGSALQDDEDIIF